MTSKQEYLTVAQLAARYSAFSEAGIRWLIRNQNKNGFHACVRRIGSNIVINVAEFEKWVEAQKTVAVNDNNS